MVLRDASDHGGGGRDLGVRAELEHDVAILREDGLCEGERRGAGVETLPDTLEALEQANDLTEVDGWRKVGLEEGLGTGVERCYDLAFGLRLLVHGDRRRQDVDLQATRLSLQSKDSVPLGGRVRAALHVEQVTKNTCIESSPPVLRVTLDADSEGNLTTNSDLKSSMLEGRRDLQVVLREAYKELLKPLLRVRRGKFHLQSTE